MQLSLKRLQAALLGEESPHFPERVHALIERQQNNSEILIGWVQFSVVCVFGILYAVSPKTFGEEADFAPVPFALAGYFAFTLWRLLVRSVSEGAAAESLSRFFDPDVARRIRGAEHEISAGIGEVREAAILFCDVRGFTNIASAMRPDAVMRLLSEYQTRMDAVIERSGGSIDKFLGDGIMATFGAVSPNERFAADALRAMTELCTVADGWNAERAAAGEVPLDIRFSVATGAVVVGAVGDGTRLEYTVLGAPVNLAAKLEKHTKVEGRSGPNDRRWSGHGGASGLSPAGGNRATIGTVH